MTRPTGASAVVLPDDGVAVDPATPEEWDDWVAASKTRNWLEQDPLLDWLDRYGVQRGFLPDTESVGYDPRTDMRLFVLERGIAFEQAVIALIRTSLESARIANQPEDSRDLSLALKTVEHMRLGVPVIEQGVLRNPQNQTYGVVDLLVRADLLDRIVSGAVPEAEMYLSAPGLGTSWHYRVVDIKFRTLSLTADGHAGSDLLHYAVQVWIYNEALSRVQGFTPPSAFLLGRGWTQGSDGRGAHCFERLARVDHAYVRRDGTSLASTAIQAVDWVRRLRREGAGWEVLPSPTVDELYPHARNRQDQPWHAAKRLVAREVSELTMLPGMNPGRRASAHAAGLGGWRDPAVSASALGVANQYAAQCDAVLSANREGTGPAVLPDLVRHVGDAWRQLAPVEFFVDFETVSNLADDFSGLPKAGGQPLIFQIGCGHLLADGRWGFAQWTADRIRETNEAVIVGSWVDHMAGVLLERGLGWEDARIIHWSAAEPVNLDNAYNAARVRHPENGWPALPWFDFLQSVVRAEPIAVRGAFDFGLKSIAKAMHAAGLIETTWAEGPTDGLGAMIGAWWCDGEAARLGARMTELPLMAEIARYNEVDCQVMAEIVGWLRANR